MPRVNLYLLAILITATLLLKLHKSPNSTSFVAFASPLSQPRHTSRRDDQTNSPIQAHCQFSGNPDVYGLGIRLGVYFQWVASHIANRNRYCKEAIGNFLDTNTIFLSALIIATALLAQEKSPTYAIEVAIVLFLIWGTLGSVLTIGGYRTRLAPRDLYHTPFSVLGAYFRLALSLTASFYSIWFWFHGLHYFDQTDCPSSIFFFARLPLLGWVRFVFQTASVIRTLDVIQLISLFITFSMVMLQLYILLESNFIYLWWYVWRPQQYPPWRRSFTEFFQSYWYIYSTSGETELGTESMQRIHGILDKNIASLDSGRNRLMRIGMRVILYIAEVWQKLGTWLNPLYSIIAPFWIVWSILAVELTLKWNGTIGVYDIRPTGQLIPFITGILSLVALLQLAVTNYLRENYWSSWLYQSYKMNFNHDETRKVRMVFRDDRSTFRRHSIATRPTSETKGQIPWPSALTQHFQPRPNILAATKEMMTHWHHPPKADDTVIVKKDPLSQAEFLLELRADGLPKTERRRYVLDEAYGCLDKDVTRLISQHLFQAQKLDTVPEFESLPQALEKLSQEDRERFEKLLRVDIVWTNGT